MLINEAGLVRAIKRAYKHGGYVVANLGDAVAIYTENWYIQANRALFSRKALATIVEHMGMIPEKNVPTSILKDEDPQLVLKEVAADDMSHWRGGERGEEVTLVPVIMQGYQIFQPPGGGPCWGVPTRFAAKWSTERAAAARCWALPRQTWISVVWSCRRPRYTPPASAGRRLRCRPRTAVRKLFPRLRHPSCRR